MKVGNGSGKWEWKKGVENGSGKWEWKMGSGKWKWEMGAKKEWHQRVMPFSLFLVSGTYMLFVQYDSTHRACTCASTALCALVRVDNIDFTSRDSSYWALACTCTASCAIASNFVSHSC